MSTFCSPLHGGAARASPNTGPNSLTVDRERPGKRRPGPGPAAVSSAPNYGGGRRRQRWACRERGSIRGAHCRVAGSRAELSAGTANTASSCGCERA
ncbi:hypothetical protein GN956_G9296 [Arapaima gigas]